MNNFRKRPLFLFVILMGMMGWGLWTSTGASGGRKEARDRDATSSRMLPPLPKQDAALQEMPPAPPPQPVKGAGKKPAPPPEVHSDNYFSPTTRKLVEGIAAGRPVQVQIGDTRRHYVFRPQQITREDFRISAGPDRQIPSSFRVYGGRRVVEGGNLTESATLAVVNDAVSMLLDTADGTVLIEQDADGNQVARLTYSHDPDHPVGHMECVIEGRAAGVRGVNDLTPPEMAAAISPVEAGTMPGAGASSFDYWHQPDHNFIRNGPQYDASLKDIVVLMVSGSTQTGSASEYNSRAASYFTFAAKAADTYENQLGLRYLLMELVLIAEDSGEPDIEVNSTQSAVNLNAVADWAAAHRPQEDYGWGHVAGWTDVSSAGISIYGWSWIAGPPWTCYGHPTWGVSVQERRFAPGIHIHELGHNIGARHTHNGVMRPSVNQINQTQNFFTENRETGASDPRPVGGATAAMDIYGYITKPAPKVYGDAPLRHPEEIPFAESDLISTALNTPVTFNPMINDRSSVMFGTENTEIRLVEVGMVYPPQSGSLSRSGNDITFTPETGFTGYVWFKYTIQGNVGNGGEGWLHAGEVLLRVGNSYENPSLTPTMRLVDDMLTSELIDPVRLNPLLNDVGEGRLWSGDVHAVTQVDGGSAEPFSDIAFKLVSATVIDGNGTVELETRPMIWDSAGGGTGNSGYVVYTPGDNEPDVVEIEYTAEDAQGSQATGTIWIHQGGLPPGPPANLVATAVDQTVELTWSPNTEDDLAGYTVYRGTAEDDISTILQDGIETNSFIDDTVVRGVTYFYALRAVDTRGNPSAFSDPVSILLEINDYAPEVDAGPDQFVTLADSVPWTPGNLAATAWYDASDLSTLTETSGGVGQWNDKSGNALHLQAVAGREPANGATIHGLNALDFDTDAMSTASNPFGDSVSDAFVILVHKVDNNDNQGTVFTLTGSNGSRWQAHTPWSGDVYFDCGGSGGASRVTTDYGTATGDTVMAGFYGSATHEVQEIYKNGVLIAGDDTGHTVGTAGNLFVGSDGGSAYQDTTLGELLILQGPVSLEDRQKLEGYLAHKWGLRDQLPPGHPYEGNAPGTVGVTLTLSGSVSDPDGNTVTTSWTQVSGPEGGVEVTDPNEQTTTAVFRQTGTYVLRLGADDGGFQPSDEITVFVTENADSDGDGMSDADELLAGSDPNDAGSFFRMVMTGGAESFFEVPTVPGRHYRVFYRDSLTSGDWQVLEGFENVTGDGDPLPVMDDTTGTRFYRIQVRAISW